MTHQELPTREETRRLAEQIRDILRADGNAALWLRRVSEAEPVALKVLPEDEQAPFPYVCIHKWWWPSDAREPARSIRVVVARSAAIAIHG